MKINPGNARGLLVPQGDRPFSFVVYSSEIRDFGLERNLLNAAPEMQLLFRNKGRIGDSQTFEKNAAP